MLHTLEWQELQAHPEVGQERGLAGCLGGRRPWLLRPLMFHIRGTGGPARTPRAHLSHGSSRVWPKGPEDLSPRYAHRHPADSEVHQPGCSGLILHARSCTHGLCQAWKQVLRISSEHPPWLASGQVYTNGLIWKGCEWGLLSSFLTGMDLGSSRDEP